MYGNRVTVFSPERDEAAVAAMAVRRAKLLADLGGRVERLVTAVTQRREQAVTEARRELVGWCRLELLPHAEAEQAKLYPYARVEPAGGVLVDSLREEHEVMADLIDGIAGAEDPVRAVLAAGALQAVLEGHLRKENDQLLPLLAHSPYVSLADVLDGADALVGDRPLAG